MQKATTKSQIYSVDSELKDYYQLMKPKVMQLVVFTSFVGMWIAPGGVNPIIGAISLFCVLMGSGSAAAFNMYYERDIDSLMSRTSKRPIVTGKISPQQALDFAWITGFLSVFIMSACVNYLSGFLLFLTIFSYAYVYTMLLKRNTDQNIVIGGISGSLPPLIGWATVTNSLALEPIILFFIIFFWTPAHFWALAIHKSLEYKKANLPMLPITRGEKTTKTHIIIYSILTAITSLIPFFIGMNGKVYAMISLTLGIIMIYRSIYLNPMQFFKFSIMYLFCIFLAITIF
jgi:protoheme IX farnesyltransferase